MTALKEKKVSKFKIGQQVKVSQKLLFDDPTYPYNQTGLIVSMHNGDCTVLIDDAYYFLTENDLDLAYASKT